MANGNKGIGSYLPFPTFGGEKSPGIMPVQLQPSPMKFPTPRAINRRTPEPDFVETIAPLLPFATEGLLGLIRGGDAAPTAADREDYIKEDILYLGEDEERDKTTPLTKIQQAKLDAYDVYGEPDEGGADWGSILANLVVGSQMGRGAGDYADTTIALKKAARTKEAAEATARATFITARTDANFQFKSLQDAEKAKQGVPDIRTGYFDPDDGETYVLTKDGFENVREVGGNWVSTADLKGDESLVEQLQDKRYVELSDKDEAINAKDTALIGTLTVANEGIKMFDKAIADPRQAPSTVVAALGNLGNSAAANFQQIAAFMGKGDVYRAFATEEDVRNQTGGSYGREGSGVLAKQLYEAIESGDDDQMKAAMAAFETGNPEVNFRELLGDVAYNNVRTRGIMLQLAYMAAAANGQTGRTLSDKDLAFHLQMVGFGSSQDPQILKDNLIAFGDTLIAQNDGRVQGAMSQNILSTGRYNLADPNFTSIIAGYWTPEKTVTGEDDWSKVGAYTFKPFQTRYKNVTAIKNWYAHVSPRARGEGWSATTGAPTDIIDPSKKLTIELENLPLQ